MTMVVSWDGGQLGQPARGGRICGAAWTIDEAYFVGRTTLQLGLSKVEATSGAVACKLMKAVHHGAVLMHMIRNYKVLQDVFSKLKITKV